MKLVSLLFRKPGLLIIRVDLVTNIHCCLLAHHLLHLDLEHDQELAEQSRAVPAVFLCLHALHSLDPGKDQR